MTPSAVAYCGVSGRPHDSARTADDDPGPRGPGRRSHPARPGRRRPAQRRRRPPPCSPSPPTPVRSPAPRAPRSARRSRGAAAGTGRSAPRTSRAGRAGSNPAAPTSTWPRTCRAPTGTPCTRSATASSSSRAPTPAATASAALPAAASSSRTPPRPGRSSTRCTGTSPGCSVKEGERVQAGQLIARVNGCRHLHFSTHPGAKYRDGNPYAGHVPKSWADHGGYVDPVKFLKTNPRAAAYKPPALPRTEIATTSAPLQYGAADGAAYWTEEGGAGSVTWRYDLATGERRTLAAGEVVPAFDTRRYDVEPARRAGARLRRHRPPARGDARGEARHAAVGRRGRAHRDRDERRRLTAAGSDRQAAAAPVRLGERRARRHRTRTARPSSSTRRRSATLAAGRVRAAAGASRMVATTSSRAARRRP